MKRKLLILLLIATALLTACDYMVVEDSDRTKVGSLFGFPAYAEEEIILMDELPEDGEGERAYPLQSGMRGENVKSLQELLTKYGFMTGRADGIFGAKTEKGVKELQQYKSEIDKNEAEARRREVLSAIETAQKNAIARLDALSFTDDESASSDEADFSFVKIFMGRKENEDKDETKPGVCDTELIEFLKNEFSVYKEDLKRGSKGKNVRRLQTRLYQMNYLPGGIDGQFGYETGEAVKYFQRLNDLKETGIADEETQRKLFSDECKKAENPVFQYKVEISISKQKVYVYKWHYGSYSKLVKTMTCTTGTVETPTPLGTYKMGGPCGRWYYFKKFDCWAQYASRIVGGILFHSVIYSEKDVSTLRQSTVNALGTRASHGCVRLSVENAEWIYRNIPAGTTCRIYN